MTRISPLPTLWRFPCPSAPSTPPAAGISNPRHQRRAPGRTFSAPPPTRSASARQPSPGGRPSPPRSRSGLPADVRRDLHGRHRSIEFIGRVGDGRKRRFPHRRADRRRRIEQSSALGSDGHLLHEHGRPQLRSNRGHVAERGMAGNRRACLTPGMPGAGAA